MSTRFIHDVQNVVRNALLDTHLLGGFLDDENFLARQYLRYALKRVARRVFHQNSPLVFPAWVSNVELEHEAVKLGFRQRVSTRVLNRVLCGNHEERAGKLARLALGRLGDLDDTVVGRVVTNVQQVEKVQRAGRGRRIDRQ